MRRAILFATLAACGCKTRLYEGPTDLKPAPPDFAIPPDATVPPDFAPPPDLTPPYYCRPIYVVDAVTAELSGFITELAQFTHVGFLNCADALPNTSPETMSIDIHGTGWVFYSNGSLFNVDLTNAKCTSTKFDPRNINPDQSTTNPMPPWQTFGSSFSLDVPNATDEKLYVSLGTDFVLAAIDPQTLAFTKGPMLPYNAELTGTAAAELWMFQPTQLPAFIGRVDKMTGFVDSRIPVPQIRLAGDFAFSFWGGSFWIFNGDGPNMGDTTVYRVDKQTGAVTTVEKNTKRHIVGAGVSGCAPLGLDR